MEASLPSSSTCFHQLKLPPYSTVEGMRDQLVAAMLGSKGFIDMT
jgi:hypothetical protein